MRAFLALVALITAAPSTEALTLEHKHKATEWRTASRFFGIPEGTAQDCSSNSSDSNSSLKSVQQDLPNLRKLRVTDGAQVHIHVNASLNFSLQMGFKEGCESDIQIFMTDDFLWIHLESQPQVPTFRRNESLVGVMKKFADMYRPIFTITMPYLSESISISNGAMVFFDTEISNDNDFDLSADNGAQVFFARRVRSRQMKIHANNGAWLTFFGGGHVDLMEGDVANGAGVVLGTPTKGLGCKEPLVSNHTAMIMSNGAMVIGGFSHVLQLAALTGAHMFTQVGESVVFECADHPHSLQLGSVASLTVYDGENLTVAGTNRGCMLNTPANPNGCPTPA